MRPNLQSWLMQGKPTRRARHLDLKYFALQDWIENDLLFLQWVSTTNNCSDRDTKLKKQINKNLLDILSLVQENILQHTLAMTKERTRKDTCYLFRC